MLRKQRANALLGFAVGFRHGIVEPVPALVGHVDALAEIRTDHFASRIGEPLCQLAAGLEIVGHCGSISRPHVIPLPLWPFCANGAEAPACAGGWISASPRRVRRPRYRRSTARALAE